VLGTAGADGVVCLFAVGSAEAHGAAPAPARVGSELGIRSKPDAGGAAAVP